MSKYIKDLINQGENQQLDFKFEVSDFTKIARSLAAFANTDGGKLLIGVKDNGAIAGVRSEEEFFMIEGAATMYCRPEVVFTSKEWEVDGRTVLEIDIKKGDHSNPHTVKEKDGKYWVYIRVDDQNLLANSVLLKVWRREQSGSGTFISFKYNEKKLLEYLEVNDQINLVELRRITGLKKFDAESLLVDFIMLQIVDMKITERDVYYHLKENYADRIREIETGPGFLNK